MLKKLLDYLDKHQIRYVSMHHSSAYTAQEVAASAHVHGGDFAKTVIVKCDGELAMAVLPAPERIDTELLQSASGSKRVELATENEFKDRFVECEVGAMPPFGNLFGMETYLEEEMINNDRIIFNAGSHTELVQLSLKDYLSLVNPEVARISTEYTAA